MFIVALSIGGVSQQKDAPLLAPQPEVLLKMGAKYTYAIKNNFQLWRFFTPVFLHGSLFHIFFNIYFQLGVAMTLEQQWNWKKFLPIYFLSAFGASLFSCLAAPNVSHLTPLHLLSFTYFPSSLTFLRLLSLTFPLHLLFPFTYFSPSLTFPLHLLSFHSHSLFFF